MLKIWEVKAQLYWAADHITSIRVVANTKRKAEMFATTILRSQHPNINDMIRIISIEEIQYA